MKDFSRIEGIPTKAFEVAWKILKGRKYKQCKVDKCQKSWDEYHMALAWEAAARSPDAQTEVGAHLTTEDHLPISTGYNGFPRKANDSLLPNLRPEKYPWMIHAEVNAILNAAIQGKSTKDSILYCTHRPCFNCTLFLWQAGVREVVFDNSTSTHCSNNEETEVNLAMFHIVTDYKLEVRGIDFKK